MVVLKPSTKLVRHELMRSHLQNTHNHLDLSVNSDVSCSEHACWISIIIRHGDISLRTSLVRVSSNPKPRVGQ